VVISVDPKEKSQELAAKLKLTYPLASDPEKKVVAAFGLETSEGIAWPAIYLLRADGKVAFRTLAEVFTERPASEEILAALDGLAAKE
jgi:peroxiredoxin